MRVDFVKAVSALLPGDPTGMFITGDVGFNALEGLRGSLGARFLNAGVAEQNMIGVAAGLALSGLKPWVYSIAPFVTYRCLEQIRNDLCLHRLPVRVVGNGGGYTYGIMGSTHHALEDLGVLKALPNLTLYFPCANDHVAAAVAQMHALPGPAYLRLAISPFTTQLPPRSENPKTLTRRYAEGSRWTLIGVGHAVQVLLSALASGALARHDASVFGVAKLPLDLEADAELRECVARSRRVLVVDEHYRQGSVAESLSLALPRVERFELLCASSAPEHRYGSTAFHLRQCGLTPEGVLARLEQAA